MKHFLLTIIAIVMLSQASLSQTKTIVGKVTDEADGKPLAGVTVRVKGTNVGAFTKGDGSYLVQVPGASNTLIFTYTGYLTREVNIDGRSEVNVTMQTSSIMTQDVIVTAFGVEREQKALGYAVQQIGGSEIAETPEANLVNSLQGRVAGVQITKGASGAGSTARIVIRGETSLTGDNQPLFVVDCVPINNKTDARSNSLRTGGNMNVDYGNGAADINPDDIESISILKGPNAAALYGSRAANGVVLITTKSGKGKRGIGVDIASSTTWESVLISPQYQNKYGQGKDFNFKFLDGFGSGIADGVDESWGPLMDGRMIEQFDSPASGTFTYSDGRTVQLRGGDVHGLQGILGKNGVDLTRRGSITPTPWIFHEDPVAAFFGTGLTTMNSISFNGSNDIGNFRLSFANLTNEGIAPNTDLIRNTISFNAGYQLADNLRISTNGQYIQNESGNRAVNGYGTESVMYLFTWYGMQINTGNLREYWQRGREGFQQFNYNYNYHDNPYFTFYENTNAMDRDRVMGNISAAYEIIPKLTLNVRTGVDFYNERRTFKRAFSTQRFPNGQYREDKITFREINSDFLLTWANKVSYDFDYSVSFGGNRMNQINNFSGLSNNKMVIPNVYTFSNTDIAIVNRLDNREKQINSLYGFGRFAYQNKLFLELTARNDWSSTLPKSNNSYFYPSATISAVLTDIFNVPQESLLNFAKLRFGVAQVGNDTDPYLLENVFSFGSPFGTNLNADESPFLANSELKPEIVTSFEIGTDLRFFDNRLGLDITYYNNISKNQIIGVPIAISSGYTNRFINAGQISSTGVEIALFGTPIKLDNGFRWDIGVNFSLDRSFVDELTEGIEQYTIMSERVIVIAKKGERMGTMWGTGFRMYDPASNQEVKFVNGKATIEQNGQRVEVDEEKLKVIYSNGLPVPNNDLRILGNYNPDWMLGIANTFSWQGIELGILFDIRHGGRIYSETRLIAATAGNIAESLWGRDAENGGSNPGMKQSGLQWVKDGVTRNDGVIGDGVKSDGAGGFVENDVIVDASAYHNRRYARGNETEGMYNASYVKLRELRLSYNLPQSWLQGLFIRNLKLSLIGRNLAIWTSSPHFDPEVVAFAGANLIPGVEAHPIPSTRTFGFDVKIGF